MIAFQEEKKCILKVPGREQYNLTVGVRGVLLRREEMGPSCH